VNYFLKAVVLSCSLIVTSAYATCSIPVVEAAANGNFEFAASRFQFTKSAQESQKKKLTQDLTTVFNGLGKVTDVVAMPSSKLKEFRRITIAPAQLPARFKFNGQWIQAKSSVLGTIQFQVAIVPGSECKLQALNVESNSPKSLGKRRFNQKYQNETLKC
jgi:hypothetical protein